MPLQDDDLLLIQRGSDHHKLTYGELKAQLAADLGLPFNAPLEETTPTMTELQNKLKQAEEIYRVGVQQYQNLQHQLIQQEGAIRTLKELVASEGTSGVS